MGRYDTDAEEDAIRAVLIGKQRFDDVVGEVESVAEGDTFGGFFERMVAASNLRRESPPVARGSGVYDEDLAFLRDALREIFRTPELPPTSGVGWKEHRQHQLAELQPSKDLVARLGVLPQSYLAERRVTERVVLATTKQRGTQDLKQARGAGSTSLWPESHFLAPLHPVLEWASDRALAALSRNEVFAVRGEHDETQVLLHGSLTNKRGQVVAASFIVVEFPDPAKPSFALPTVVADIGEALDRLRIQSVNTGAVRDPGRFDALLAPAVDSAGGAVHGLVQAARADTVARVESWKRRATAWEHDAEALIQRSALRDRRAEIAQEQDIAEALLPQQVLVRPLLVVAGSEV